MSRIGNAPIPVPDGVTVTIEPARVAVAGPLGTLQQQVPTRMKVDIAKLLKEEGYIRDYHVEKGDSFDTLVIDLKFGRNRERVISGLKRVSKPGRRVYARKDRLPRVLGGMGVAILSTSSGLVTSRTAQERGIGGEVVAFIW